MRIFISVLSQSTTSLNRQFKPAHCLYENNLNFKKCNLI